MKTWMSFEKSASTYHRHASGPRKLGRALRDWLPGPHLEGRVLELGCGTGLFSRHLVHRLPRAEFFFTDASPVLLRLHRRHLEPKCAGSHCRWLVLDAQSALPRGDFQLVVSNALVQWLDHLPSHFKNVRESLTTQGTYLASGVGGGNFGELRGLLREYWPQRMGLPGISREPLETCLLGTGLALEDFAPLRWVNTYGGSLEFLRELKASGARGPGPRAWHPAPLRKVLRAYDGKYSHPGGIRVSWEGWLARFRGHPTAER